MKLNIAYPANGTVKQFELDPEYLRKTSVYDQKLGNDVDGTVFGEQFKGYIFRMKGGSDKEGFPMVTGVLASSRVSLMIKRGAIGFNTFRGRSGERRRKSLRGCLMGQDIACVNVVILKIGEKPIEGVTDVSNPRRLGPKRASSIRKFFNLDRDEDVRRYVIKRKVEKAGKKARFKSAKIQRLITPLVKARRLRKVKAQQAALRKSQQQRREFLSLICKRRMAHRQAKAAVVRGKRDNLFRQSEKKVKAGNKTKGK